MTTMEHRYHERPPVADLRGVLACTWTRSWSIGAALIVIDVVPDACIDIVWRDDGLLLVAGPDTGPWRAPIVGSRYVGARFLPGAAPGLLGAPASALRDRRVELADLWGRRCAERLAEELAAAPDQAEEILTRALARQLRQAAPPDPLVRALVGRLQHGRMGVAAAAAALGVSERQLRRRCEAAVGYSPKVLERVLRFQRFRSLARLSAAPLVELALAAGYADQAHLSRDHRRLAGSTPGGVRVRAG